MGSTGYQGKWDLLAIKVNGTYWLSGQMRSTGYQGKWDLLAIRVVCKSLTLPEVQEVKTHSCACNTIGLYTKYDYKFVGCFTCWERILSPQSYYSMEDIFHSSCQTQPKLTLYTRKCVTCILHLWYIYVAFLVYYTCNSYTCNRCIEHL